MNKYGLALAAPVTQTILPVMTETGNVIGFYAIASTEFDGTETTTTTSDGVVVPLKTVTVDANPEMRAVAQYMAAVWPRGLAVKYEPWASADLIAPGEGSYSWWSMPTQSWVHHFGKGFLLEAIQNNLEVNVAPRLPGPPTVPDASSNAQTWTASASYQALMGDASFFDFNWMTVFSAKNNNGADPLRISVLANPPAVGGVVPMKASVIGMPVAIAGGGVVYDTIRVIRLATLTPGPYVFSFRITDTKDLTTDVTFTLNVL